MARPFKTPAPPEQVERLRVNASRLGLTASDLARLGGLAPVTVCQYFDGRLSCPLDRAEQLEKALLEYVDETATTVQLVKADLIRQTTWSTQPKEARALGKKGGK